MVNLFKVLSVAIMILFSFSSLQVQTVSASSKPWYSATTYSDSSEVKVKVGNGSKMTNKDVIITIDASKYNNGDNVIVFNPGDNNKIVTYGNTFTTKVKANGDYDFLVQRREYYDPQSGDPNTIWCGATIKNIDKSKPIFKESKTSIYDFGNDMFLTASFEDNIAIKRVKLPTGEYVDNIIGDINKENFLGSSVSETIVVYKNGKYTFEAEDYAGNVTKKTITVKNNKPVPIKVNKVTTKSKYITGKVVPRANVIVKTKDLDFYEVTTTDKKGNFKLKLDKSVKSHKELIVEGKVSREDYNYNSGQIHVKIHK